MAYAQFERTKKRRTKNIRLAIKRMIELWIEQIASMIARIMARMICHVYHVLYTMPFTCRSLLFCFLLLFSEPYSVCRKK